MPASESQSSMAGPVAVIAVHGVADQEKDQTAVRAANLLLHVGKGEGAAGADPKPGYTGFEQEKIRVGVEPLNIAGVGKEDAWQYQLRGHLEKYEGEGTQGSYETVRMEGYRTTKQGTDAKPQLDRPVHVYEMYWADASRLPIGVLNLFLGIYRLLFQTSWLGVQTIGPWASFGKDVGKWSKFTSLRGLMLLLHSACSLILTRFMPLLYLLMIGLLMLMAIPVVESQWARGLVGGLGGYPGLFALDAVLVVAALMIATCAKLWRTIPWPPLYGVVAVVCFLVWNLAFAMFQDQSGSWLAESGVALASWGVICLMICLFVVPVIGKRFPGSGVVALGLMGYFTLFLILGLMRQTEWPLLIAAPLLALRMGFALLPFAWILLATSANLFLILAALESVSYWFRRGVDREVVRRRRARLRTAIISIVLPVLLISFLNSTFFLLALIPFKMGLVDGAAPLAGRMADAPGWVQPVGDAVASYVEPFASKWASMPGFREWVGTQAGADVRFSDYAKYASQMMVVPFLEAVFLVVLLVLGYSLWVVAPAVLAEHSDRRAVRKSDKTEKLSKALGDNLSQGYSWIWSGQVVLAACLLATQVLFAVRANRGAAQQSGPGSPTPDPVMMLVDQFLGVRHLGGSVAAVPAVVAMVETPSSVRVVPTPGTPGGAMPSGGAAAAGSGAPVAEVTALAPAARSAVRRPPFPPPGRSQFASRVNRQGEPLRLPIPQQSYEQRQEVRETIEGIFKHRRADSPVRPLMQPGPAATGAGPGGPAGEAPPGLVVKALTEAVLFLNTGPLTSALGAAILLLALGYFFFARLVDPIVSGLRGGLDIALDVLNYLRPRPVEQTPRARILSRYASLLRYIVNWRDPRNPSQGYSRIVILAHSQGTVITSDVLRALAIGNVAGDNDLELLRSNPDSSSGVPIRVFTMGSPLRQLYASRFPDLYAWDSAEDPRQNHRAVECWWNAYRSGDYVGRMLFRQEQDPDRFIPGREYSLMKDGKKLPVREACIGPGAHTHYWDETAPTVIRDLDRLVACDRIEDL